MVGLYGPYQWWRVPVKIQNYTGDYTPVYEGGNFVWWDVSRWCILVDDDML